MSRLVVTGASGFIGGRIVEAALARGIEVIALSRNPSAVLLQSRPGLQVKRWQVGEPLPELRDASALCHLAAYMPSDFSDPGQAASCFETNVIGATNLALQAADRGIKRFLYFGSGQIYSPHEPSANEQSIVYPLERATYYLASKFAGELCVQAAAKRKSLQTVVLRLASIYGPGMHVGGMLPKFVSRLSAGQTVTVMDGGAYHLDLAYIDDVLDVTFKAIASQATGIFNVGSGVASTALESATIIADALGASRDLIVVHGDARACGFAALDISKAAQEFNYKPTSLQQGVGRWLQDRQKSSTRK
jgi:UDP-glucose 4-epimerase